MSAAMSNLVTSVLRRPEISRINFSVGGISVTPSSFLLVNNRFLQGKLDAEYDHKLAAYKACKYDSKNNTIYLGFKSLHNSSQESLIVHECVHAARDTGLFAIKKKVDEAAAYIAQSLYFYYRNEKSLLRGVRPTFGRNAILKESWLVASVVRAKPRLKDGDIAALLRIISSHPLYANSANNMTFSDG